MTQFVLDWPVRDPVVGTLFLLCGLGAYMRRVATA
jgi:hypothetical protein